MNCFHCNGTRQCSCLVCGKDGAASGPCQSCEGREKWNRLRPILERKGIDPRDARHWILMKPEAPAHPFRRFLPEVELEALLKRKGAA